jgi:hypothetical protein
MAPRRRLGSGLLGLVLAAALLMAVGSAASLAFSGQGLGAGRATVAACSTAAIGVTQVLTTSNVTGVALTSIPAACGGATARVTVNNGTSNSSASATVPTGGGSVTLTLAAAVALATSDQVELLIVGP